MKCSRDDLREVGTLSNVKLLVCTCFRKHPCQPVACMVISACSMACTFYVLRISKTARQGLHVRTSRQSQRPTLALLSSGLVPADPCHRSKLSSSGDGKVNSRTGPSAGHPVAPRSHQKAHAGRSATHLACAWTRLVIDSFTSLALFHCDLSSHAVRSPLDREYAVTATDAPWSGPPHCP